MNAKQLVKKLGKLLGKKGNGTAVGEMAGMDQTNAVLALVDKLGPIQLNPNWRN